jgi:HK97 family phage major capsid protein
MRTIEDIQADMAAIMDAAVDAKGKKRNFTPDEITAYEKLEDELQQTNASAQLRARNQAYNMPANVPYADTSQRVDDGLEKAYDNYLRTGMPNADLSSLRVSNVQGEGTGSAGGYMVPPGFRQKIVERMVAFGGFAAEAEPITTSTGNNIEYPTLDDTSNTGAITAESASVASGADLVFGTVALGAYKYTSAGAGSNLPLRVPVELLQDSAFDVQALVSRALGTRIARAQAAHWVTGNGVGQPKGIVASSLTADRDLDTADTLDYEDLVDTQDLLDESYEPGAKWLMNKNTWSQVRLIVDTNGRPLVQDSTAGISEKPKRLLLGSGVILDEAMPTLSSAGDTFPIAYGDFRESYVIRRVASLTIVVDPYSRAKHGEVEFTAWERADGNIQNRNSYVILQNNT